MKGPTEVRANLFGGEGRVAVSDLLAGRVAAPFTAVLACELEPGGSVGVHVQHEFSEIVIGLDGEGEARIDGKSQPLGPGDVVYLPLGATLTLRNLSSLEPLQYLIVKARG